MSRVLVMGRWCKQVGWPVATPSCVEQVVKSEAATKIQKAMRGFVWRRVFRGMVQEVQAVAQAKEEAAAKKASGPNKAVLKDKALSDQALFAKRCERKARKAKAKAEKQALANNVGAEPGVAMSQPEWSAEMEVEKISLPPPF